MAMAAAADFQVILVIVILVIASSLHRFRLGRGPSRRAAA
jgi:hypothetical protein